MKKIVLTTGVVLFVLAFISLLRVKPFLQTNSQQVTASPASIVITQFKGKIVQIDGTVLYKRDSQWLSASLNQTVPGGTEIKTAEKSQVHIRFDTLAELRLDENTEIVLNEININRIYILQNAGSTYSRIRRLLGKDSTYEVETPMTVATVRGTAFAVFFDGQAAKIAVSENQVAVKPIHYQNGQKTVLTETIVSDKQAVEITPKLAQAIVRNQTKLQTVSTTQIITPKQASWLSENNREDKKFEDAVQKELEIHISPSLQSFASPILMKPVISPVPTPLPAIIQDTNVLNLQDTKTVNPTPTPSLQLDILQKDPQVMQSLLVSPTPSPVLFKVAPNTFETLR